MKKNLTNGFETSDRHHSGQFQSIENSCQTDSDFSTFFKPDLQTEVEQLTITKDPGDVGEQCSNTWQALEVCD